MFREDMRDLMGLTEKKMDNVATATVFLIGATMVIMVEGPACLHRSCTADRVANLRCRLQDRRDLA